MKNQKFSKLLKKNKPHSGFTLTELLVGIVMSGIVVGAFGFGLMQVLRISRGETSKINARTETARAMEFITEEIKRASAIEPDATNAALFDSNGKTVVLALDIPDITDNVNLGADNDPSTSERIVYYLQAASGNWRAPQVLYRWGPPLNNNGEYTENTWQSEALIDALDNTALDASPCEAGDTLTPVLAEATEGFHACLTGTNIAHLFFSGVTRDAQGNDGDSYKADTKVFVRARNPNFANQEAVADSKLYFKTLGATYSCDPFDPDPAQRDWIIRTDFGNNPSDLDDTTPWIHEENRQAQPIDIDTNQPLVISTSPVGRTNCLSLGNEDTTGGETLSSYSHSVTFTIDFDDPATFNGTGGNPDVTGDGFVMIYKNGDQVETAYQGYAPNDSTPPQQAILEFLDDHGYVDGDGKVTGLEPNERIITLELGQTDNGRPKDDHINEAPWHPDHVPGQDDYYDRSGDGKAHPGFDVQDSVFILSNDKFNYTDE